nr:hypothetical protein CFP56_20324 [Quercus suber]
MGLIVSGTRRYSEAVSCVEENVIDSRKLVPFKEISGKEYDSWLTSSGLLFPALRKSVVADDSTVCDQFVIRNASFRRSEEATITSA